MKNNVEKQQQNDNKNLEKQLKNEKKSSKKIDKTLVISISICVAIALLVVGIVTLPEPITAAINLGKTRDFLANVEEPTVLLNDAGEYTGLLETKEAVLEDKEAETLVRQLLLVLENAKYSDTIGASYGVWKTKIVVYNTTDKADVYIDGDGIYILHNDRLIKYKITESGAEKHKALLSSINERLDAATDS